MAHSKTFGHVLHTTLFLNSVNSFGNFKALFKIVPQNCQKCSTCIPHCNSERKGIAESY